MQKQTSLITGRGRPVAGGWHARKTCLVPPAVSIFLIALALVSPSVGARPVSSTAALPVIPGVLSYQVRQFDPALLLDNAMRNGRISVDLGAGEATLLLKPEMLISPNAVVLGSDGKVLDSDLSSIHAFGGTVVGQSDSSVALTFSSGSFTLWIRSGSLVKIAESLKKWDRSADDGSYVVYDSNSVRINGNLENDTITPPRAAPSVPVAAYSSVEAQRTASANASVSTGTQLLSDPLLSNAETRTSPSQNGNKSGNAARDAVYRIASIAAVADPQYQQAYSDWQGALSTTVNDLSLILQPQAFVTVQVVEFRIWSGDSNVLDAWPLLDDFRQFMLSDTSGFNVAHLFTGKVMNNGVLGTSYIRGVGSSYAYALTSQVAGNGADGSEFQKSILVAHEVGHNFNGVHEQAVQTANGKWTIMAGSWQGSNYNSFYSDGSMNVLDNNKQRITRWAWANLPQVAVMADGLPDVSADGVRLLVFGVTSADILQPNQQVTAQFLIMNANSYSMYFPSPGIFVGARDAAGNNKDFGLTGAVTVSSQGWYLLTATRTVTSSGMWQFWPAYYYNGHYGPYQWHYQTRSAYYVLGKTAVPTLTYYVQAGVGFRGMTVTAPRSGSGLAYYFYLLSYSSTPVKGSTVFAYSTMFWTDTTSPAIRYYFVAARNYAGNNRDFGWTSSFNPAPRAHTEFNDVDSQGNPQPGGGAMVYFGSRTLDSTGSWDFWTVYCDMNWFFYNFADDIYLTV